MLSVTSMSSVALSCVSSANPWRRRLGSTSTKCAVQCGPAGWVHVNRVCISAKVVKANGSAVFSPLNHRDLSVNLQGRTFAVPANSYTHNTSSTQSARHIN